MFRVLDDEEAKKVVRWKAPDIGNNLSMTANTPQIVKPQGTPAETPVRSVISGKTSNSEQGLPAEPGPRMKKVVSVEEPVYKPTTGKGHNRVAGSASTANVPQPNPSADMLQASYDEGYSQGYAKGYAALHEQTVSELDSTIAGLKQAANEHRDEALEREVLAMSLKIASLLLQREIEVNTDALYQLVRLGLEQLPATTSDTRRIRLHPLDANRVRELLVQNPEVEVLDDSTLERGQCRLEAGASIVNAGVDDWLENMAFQLGLVDPVGLSPITGLSTN